MLIWMKHKSVILMPTRILTIFFIRPLKKELRPITSGSDDIASPVDGVIDQYGTIDDGHIFHAKRAKLKLCTLLGMQTPQKTAFDRGHFIIFYLSPKDYHRVHMPFHGQLTAMRYIPGKLFSVQPATVAKIDGIFTRNERVVSFFQTELGEMAVILVGAMIVGNIHLNWHGDVNGQKSSQVQYWDYSQSRSVVMHRGDEIGHFKLGSTVIVLFNENMSIQWSKQLEPLNTVRFGQLIAQIKR